MLATLRRSVRTWCSGTGDDVRGLTVTGLPAVEAQRGSRRLPRCRPAGGRGGPAASGRRRRRPGVRGGVYFLGFPPGRIVYLSKTDDGTRPSRNAAKEGAIWKSWSRSTLSHVTVGASPFR